MKTLTAAMSALVISGSVYADNDPMPFEAIGYGPLMDRWKQAAEDFGVPGASIAFIKDGELVALESFGIRDQGERVTPDTMFYIASATKPYVGAAIVGLAAEGRIDLDEPVRTYLPRFRVASQGATTDITVRDLLSHARGLSSGPIVLLDAYTGEITEDRFYRWLREAQPRESLEYTNLHFTLLGRVIESVTGMPWQDYLDESLFTPIGMHRTTAYASEMYADPDAAFPMVETKDGFEIARQVKNDSVMHAAGGMGCSAADGARWLLFHLSGGAVDGEQLIPARTISDMQTLQASYPQTDGQVRAMEGYGLAWHVGTWRGMTPYIVHNGGYVGTAAHFSFMPDKGLGVVVLCNASPAGQGLCDIVSIDLYDRELGVAEPLDLVRPYANHLDQMRNERDQREAPQRLTSRTLSLGASRYAGLYTSEDLGTFRVYFEQGRLRASLGTMHGTLVESGTDRFNVEFAESSAAGSFEVRDGRVTRVTLDFDGGLTGVFSR